MQYLIRISASWTAISILLLGVCLCCVSFASQASSTQSGNQWTIGGAVRDAAGRGIEGAEVNAVGAGGYAATTDANGRFEITGVTAGRYGVYARKLGYVSAHIALIDTTPGSSHSLDLILEGESVILGRLVSEKGEPIAGAEVIAWQRAFHNGIPRMSPGGSAKSDQSGQFQIKGLQRRSYFVGVVPPRTLSGPGNRNQQDSSLPTMTLYPGTQTLDNAVQVPAGEKAKEIRMVIRQAESFCIRGAISPGLNADGGKASWTLVQKMSGFDYTVRMAEVSLKAPFQICGLTPGIDYELRATTWDRDGKAVGVASARFNISSREAEAGVVNLGKLVVTGSRSIAGRMRIAADAIDTLHCPGHIILALETGAPAYAGESMSTRPDNSCQFKFDTLFSHEYRMQLLGLPPGLYVKSATCGRHEVLQDEWMPDCDNIDVELERGGASISGNVIDSEGKSVIDAEAILISDADAHNILAQPVNHDGKFTFASLAPGSYRLVAVSGISDDDASNPEIAAKYAAQANSLQLRYQENQGISLTAVKAEDDPASIP